MRQVKQINIFFVTLLILWSAMGVAQEIEFNKLSSPDGGNFGYMITGITQDYDGNMWFTTKQGLYKYNGNQITGYQNNPLNINSISSNNLESIFADNDGIIWIGTLGKGLDQLDPKTGVFTHFQHESENIGSISNDTITTILRDNLGDLYIGTHQGLNKYNAETNQFTHFKHDIQDPKSISNNQVRALYETKDGTIWVGTGSPYADNGGGPEDGGFNKFDKESGTFTRYLYDSDDESSLGNNKISAIYEDNEGVLWIGTARNMMHKMDRVNGTFERLAYDPEFPENLAVPKAVTELPDFDHVTFMTQDSSGKFWYGTVAQGIYLIDSQRSKIVKYQNADSHVKGFESEGAWSVYNSRDGIMWLGGIDLGDIFSVNPNKIVIDHFPIENGVNEFYEESNGDLWIGGDANLLVKKKNGKIVNRDVKDLEPTFEHDNWYSEIKEDKEGNIWVGGFNGLNRWDKDKNEFIQYYHSSDGNSIPPDHMVTSFVSDNEENLWLGTVNGLNYFDIKTDEFSRFFLDKRDTTTVGYNVISRVFMDRKSRLWVGMFNGGGLYLYDTELNTGKKYLGSLDINSLYQDHSGLLWIGSSAGLFWYDEQNDNFVKFSNAFLIGGISYVANIQEDDENNLWVSSDIGLVQINPDRDQISIFGYDSGVSSYNFHWDAGYKNSKGQLYFGNDEGYFLFDPKALNDQMKSPEIRITGFSLADEEITPDRNGPLKENLAKAVEIKLEHDQNVFSFDFTTVDYANPKKNRIIYYLENYDKNWSKSNAENKAYYFNIPPGDYTFHIKGSNGYGPWAERKISIIISPPWWQTWWAYISYVILLAIGILTFHRFMRQRLIRIERERSQEKELKQAKEIEKAYTKLKRTQSQLVQSEKMASLGELTAGIAHEIQNPLNFVNNFSEVNAELLMEMKEEIEKKNYEEVSEIADDVITNQQKINQHGKRADAIVKGMLQHSRTSSGQKELTDINALTDEFLRLAYHGLRAKDKSFNAKLETHFDESLGKVNIVAQDVGRVILNLINNAFYAVNDRKKQGGENYEPTVSVGTKKLGETIEIEVTDNGSGIPPEIKDKIFQPFFTSKPTGEGTGLGLSLSYDIVKSHGGELKVETKRSNHENLVNSDTGTSFIIILPAG